MNLSGQHERALSSWSKTRLEHYENHPCRAAGKSAQRRGNDMPVPPAPPPASLLNSSSRVWGEAAQLRAPLFPHRVAHLGSKVMMLITLPALCSSLSEARRKFSCVPFADTPGKRSPRCWFRQGRVTSWLNVRSSRAAAPLPGPG